MCLKHFFSIYELTMPLPPALAARLAKRGIIKQDGDEDNKGVSEEVFVEQYDDPSDHADSSQKTSQDKTQEADDSGQLTHEIINCPNKKNKYHECVDYCRKRYGLKNFKADPTMVEKKSRILQKYPLPANWLEVADPETNRYYYWNTETDEVSWLPPWHPRASIGPSADKVKARRRSRGSDSSSSSESSDSGSESDSDKSDKSDQEQPLNMDDFERLEAEMLRERQRRELAKQDGDDRYGDKDEEPADRRGDMRLDRRGDRELEERRGGGPVGRKRRKRDDLDPMDPAAYSDIPRGTWSTGLEKTGVKTGADTTAAGPLFQQRPYPSPGAVLRMNKTD